MLTQRSSCDSWPDRQVRKPRYRFVSEIRQLFSVAEIEPSELSSIQCVV